MDQSFVVLAGATLRRICTAPDKSCKIPPVTNPARVTAQ